VTIAVESAAYLSETRTMSALDAANILKAQQGDEKARNRMLGALEPMLRGFFRKRIGASIEVDDLVQNTLLRVHRGLRHLEQADRLKAFAMKAALYELNDLYRGRYGSREAALDPEVQIPSSGEAAPAGLRLDLERALKVITPHARQIIELREAGYRYAEIADLLETSEAAVKMQVKRAFERLRPALLTLFMLFTTLATQL
jgi:RNA polymerase sigma-70 factor, ECF subfamily